MPREDDAELGDVSTSQEASRIKSTPPESKGGEGVLGYLWTRREISLLLEPGWVPGAGNAALGHTAHGGPVLSAAIHPQSGCTRSEEPAPAQWACRVELGPLLWGAGSTQLEGEGSLLGLMPSLTV